MSKAEDLSKQYSDYREQCGIKDPVMLDEIEEAYFEGYSQAEKDNELTCKDTKDEFLSEFLAKTLSRKLGINRMPECEKEECNKTYIPDPYQPDAPRYQYFEAYKEGYLAAISIAEDILVKMFNEYDNLTKD